MGGREGERGGPVHEQAGRGEARSTNYPGEGRNGPQTDRNIGGTVGKRLEGNSLVRRSALNVATIAYTGLQEPPAWPPLRN